MGAQRERLTPAKYRSIVGQMKHLKDYTVAELRRAIALKEQIENLQGELAAFGDGPETEVPKTEGKRRMSAAARRKIGLAQKARWAKQNGKAGDKPVSKKRRMSAASRARIAAAAKARWAKVREAGGNTLAKAS